MATTTFTCNKDSRLADNGSNMGAGTSDFNPVGNHGGYLYRTLLGFSYSFSGMVSITSAILKVRVSTQYYVAFGSDPDIYVAALASSWSEGSSSGLSTGNSVVFPGPATIGSFAGPFDISTVEGTWMSLNITTIMQQRLAAGIFYGLRLYPVSTSSGVDVTEFYAREQGSSDPYIEITYTTNNAPSAPTAMSPSGGGVAPGGAVPLFAFTHVDPNGDALLDYDIQVTTDPTWATATHWSALAQTTGITGNNVSKAYGGTALTGGVTYYWRARTSSATGVLTEGAWSATQSFKINRDPTVSFVTPSAADALVEMVKVAGVATAPRMVIRWAFSDPDGFPQATYRVVVVTDALAAFHDSTVLTGADQSYVVPVDPARNTFYRVTVTVTDSAGASVSTAQVRLKVQWAVVEYKLNTLGTVTAWSTAEASTRTDPDHQLVVTEFASSAGGAAISTWYSSLSSAALAQWFHWRVWLFAWSGAASPSFTKMALTYTNSAAVPPDGWTTTGQHSLDTGTKVYGTQSLKVTCNGSSVSAYQLVKLQKNTDYILSGRIKSDGNSQAKINLASASSGGTVYATTVPLAGTSEWARFVTGVWNSGSNEEAYVKVVVAGAAGTFAWFDALKLENSKVVTAWTPGFVGAGVSVDAGGIRVDASPTGGATFRLQGSGGGARDTVELGIGGLVFAGDTGLSSPADGFLAVDGNVLARVLDIPAPYVPVTTAIGGFYQGPTKTGIATTAVLAPFTTGGRINAGGLYVVGAGEAGLYWVGIKGVIIALGSAAAWRIFIYKNGANIGTGQGGWQVVANNGAGISEFGIVDLAVGDTIGLWVNGGSGTAAASMTPYLHIVRLASAFA